MTKEELKMQFDILQDRFGSEKCNSVYGGGREEGADLCLVFINPTARNIATSKAWNGVRYQWLGTKQVWNFLCKCNLFSAELNAKIQSMKPGEWTNEFCKEVYAEVERNGLYITNLAKCTQDDARELPRNVFESYRDLLFEEFDLIRPKKIILFGNQVSSIVLGEKISVSACRKKAYKLKTEKNEFETYCVYYPVGNGFFNAPKAIEDIIYIKN